MIHNGKEYYIDFFYDSLHIRITFVDNNNVWPLPTHIKTKREIVSNVLTKLRKSDLRYNAEKYIFDNILSKDHVKIQFFSKEDITYAKLIL